MSYVAVNGEPVFHAVIAFPRFGAWHADLAIASAVVPTGQVTLTFGTGAISWKGFAYRGGAPFETATLRIVGGAGGIATGAQLTSQAYQNTPLSIPLQDILTATGETLSPNADPTVLNAGLRTWNRLAGPAGMAVSALVSAVGASWRFMPDGTLWVGQETWPTDTEAYTLLNDSPMYGEQEVFADAPNMRPGTILSGRKVSYVQHKFTAHSLLTEVLYEDQAAASIGQIDRVKGPLTAFIRAVNSNLAAGQWEGTIVSQSSNNATVDFVPDDPRVPKAQAVPLKLGLAYSSATLSTPCRGVLFYANQDLQKPRVGLLDNDAQFSALTLAGGTEGAARVNDLVVAGTTMSTFIATVTAGFNIMAGLFNVPGPMTGAPGTVPTLAVQPTDFGVINTGSAKVTVG